MQAYTLAVITLAIGIAVGYFARGSAPVSTAGESAQATSAPAGMGGAPMGSAQLPGIGSGQQQQAASPEALAKAAEPLLAQLKTNPNDFDSIVKLEICTTTAKPILKLSSTTKRLWTFNPTTSMCALTSAPLTGTPVTPTRQSQTSKKLWLSGQIRWPTLFNLGIVRWQGKKDPKGAIVAWEKLLQTNPDYPQKDQVQKLIEGAKMHGASGSKG